VKLWQARGKLMDWHNNIIFFCGFTALLSPNFFLPVKLTLFQICYAIYSNLKCSIQLSLYYNSYKTLQAIQHIIPCCLYLILFEDCQLPVFSYVIKFK